MGVGTLVSVLALAGVGSLSAAWIVRPALARRRQLRGQLASSLRHVELHEKVWRNIPMGILVVDTEGIIVWCNPHFSTALGRQKFELVGQPFKKFLATRKRKDTLEAWQAAMSPPNGGDIHEVFVNYYEHADGYDIRMRWLRGSGAAIEHGLHTAFCMIDRPEDLTNDN